MKGIRKVLIAVNGSQELLREGLRIAGDEKCWITVLKVVPQYDGDLSLTCIKNIQDVLDSGALEASVLLDGMISRERSIARVRVENGDISETIAHVANEEKCDLIIMGKRKNKGLLDRLFGGNITGRVIRMASCPVLIVNQ